MSGGPGIGVVWWSQRGASTDAAPRSCGSRRREKVASRAGRASPVIGSSDCSEPTGCLIGHGRYFILQLAAVDADSRSADPRAYRAARAASDVIESTTDADRMNPTHTEGHR